MARVEHKDLIAPDVDAKIKALQQALLDLDKTIDNLAASFKPAKTAVDQLKKSTTSLLTATKAGQAGIKENAVTVAELAKKQMEATRTANEWKKVILQSSDAIKIAETNEKRLIAAIAAENVQTKEGAKNIRLLNNERKKNIAELARLTKATKTQTAAIKDEVGSYNQLQKELKENVAAYKKMSAAERETTKDGKKLTRTIRAQEAQLKRLDSAIGRSFRNVGNYGSALNGARGALLGIAAGAGIATGATLLIGKALKDSIELIVDFQKQNTILGGILGKTRDEISSLTDDAKLLGGTTIKTASEITQLQISLARLGFAESEILNLTEDLVVGSIALNANLQETGALVGAIVRTFDDLETTDGGAIVDSLTLATQRSALSFDRLQTSIPIVAGAANALGVPLNRTVALLGKLADAGIDASSSATSLRNIFIESAKQGVPFQVLLDKVANSTDKLRTANELFGKRAAVAASIVADLSTEIGDFETSLDGAEGAAKTFSEEVLKTLSGRVDQVKASYEAFILAIDSGDDVVSGAINGFLQVTDAVLKFAKGLATSNQETEVLLASELGKKLAKETDNLTRSLFIQEERLRTAKQEFKDFGLSMARAQDFSDESIESYKKQEKEIERLEALVKPLRAAQDALNKSWDDGEDSVNNLAGATTSYKDVLKELDTLFKATDLTALFSGEFLQAKEKRVKLSDIVDIQSFIDGEDSIKAIENGMEDFFNTFEVLDQEAGEFTFLEKLNDFFISNKDQIIEAAFALAEGISDVFSGLNDRRNEQIQQELDAIIVNRDAQIASINATQASEEQKAAEIEKINEKAAEQQKRLSREKAENDKRTAIFEAIIATAVGVARALPNVFLAAVVGGLGAAEIATIAATPLPAFAVGTESSPAGPALVGEKGSELVVTPSGDLSLTPSSTSVMDLERGSKIYTAQETKNILDAFGNSARNLSDPIIASTGLTSDEFHRGICRMEDAFENRAEQVFQINKNGIDLFYRHKGNKTAYYNKRYN